MKVLFPIACLIILLTTKTLHGQVNAASPPINGQEELPVFTLQQILDSIDARNPGLQQYALKTQASLAMGDAVKAWQAPTAGIGVNEFPYGAVDSKMNNNSVPRRMLMVRLEQVFPNFSRQRKEQQVYRSYASQNADDRATMKNLLFSRAKKAYDETWIAEKKLSVIREQEKQLQLLIRIAEGRLAYNKASLPNIYKARAKLSDLHALQVKMSSTADQAVATLNSLMNFPADTPLKIDTTVDLTAMPANILPVDSIYVETHRSDIRSISDEIRSMQLKKEATAAMNKPEFGLTWDNMRMNGGMYMYNAMVMLSIPLVPWFSKGYRSEIRAMDFEVQAMQKMQDSQVQQAMGNIRKERLGLQSELTELELFRNEVIPAYEKTWQANLNALSENTGDIYETLMAWNELTLKRMEYYDKLEEVLNEKVILESEIQSY